MDGKNVLSNPLQVWRIATVREKTSDEYAIIFINMFFYNWFKTIDVKHVAIASVVPSLNDTFEEKAKKYFNKTVFFINHKNCGDLKFAFLDKKEVGTDRIADAVAAYFMYGGSCIIIDFRAATTFYCIDSKGRYLGGAIAPGPLISAQSLSLKTAQLHKLN
jgi:type III pantothenate kinase